MQWIFLVRPHRVGGCFVELSQRAILTGQVPEASVAAAAVVRLIDQASKVGRWITCKDFDVHAAS